MSLILDALRRRTKIEPRVGDARTGGVPDTLGYRRRPSRRRLSPQRIIGIAAGAIALGFLAVALPVYRVARQTARQQTAAVAAIRVGDYDNALAQYRILLEQQATSAEVHDNLGLLHQARGHHDDAIREFRRAIALDPSYVKAHNNLGVAYLRTRQLNDAAAELEALGIDDRNIESLVNLPLVQKDSGRTAEARELLRRALTLDPQHAGSHYNLAVVADEGGDLSTAMTHYRAFLRYGAVGYPDLAARVRSRLTTLETG